MISIRNDSKFFWRIILTAVLLFSGGGEIFSIENLDELDMKVQSWAIECRQEIKVVFEKLIVTGALSEKDLFDTIYVPIPQTNPQKYHTNYDELFDIKIQSILDRFLKKDPKLIFVVLVDKNGYLPTHNRKFSDTQHQKKAGSIKWNRSKRLFSDTAGLAAARNMKSFLLQSYSRDTGEIMFDQSIPLFFRGKHWGAVRFGYRK